MVISSNQIGVLERQPIRIMGLNILTILEVSGRMYTLKEVVGRWNYGLMLDK